MQDKIVKIVQEATKAEADKITPETNFVEDLNLDSLDMVELMMKVEDEFGVEIPEDDTDGLKTVQDVVNYLEKKVNA